MSKRDSKRLREETVDVGELDHSARVLCFEVKAQRRRNLMRAVEQAEATLDSLEAAGFVVKGLEIRGHALRTNGTTQSLEDVLR